MYENEFGYPIEQLLNIWSCKHEPLQNYKYELINIREVNENETHKDEWSSGSIMVSLKEYQNEILLQFLSDYRLGNWEKKLYFLILALTYLQT